MVHLLRVVSVVLIITFLPVTNTQILDDVGDIISAASDSDIDASSVPATVPRRLGLCRDGWSPGAILDINGQENPVCIKINQQSQTWSEAQATCRKDYGFLLKLDSPSTINGVDLLPYLADEGIQRLWTGLHTYADHLVWDDLVPNLVKPHTLNNGTYVSTRPWAWGNRRIPQSSKLCGQLNIKQNDKKRRRRKRAPDEDSPDSFFLPSLQDRFYQFRDPGPEKYLPTGEFQSMLSRTQFSDQLSEIPGIQSEHQIPGTGLSDTNLQTGGLLTDMSNFDNAIKLEGDDKEATNSDILSQNGMQNGFFATQPPMQQAELLNSVKDIADNLANGHVPDLSSLISDSVKESNRFNIENLKDKPIDSGTSNNFVNIPPDKLDVSVGKDFLDTLNTKDENSNDRPMLNTLNDMLPEQSTFPTDDTTKNSTDTASNFDAILDTGNSVSSDDNNNPPSFGNINNLNKALIENVGMDKSDQGKILNFDSPDSTSSNNIELIRDSSDIPTESVNEIKDVVDKTIEPVTETEIASDSSDSQTPTFDIPTLDGQFSPSEENNKIQEIDSNNIHNFGSIPDLNDLLSLDKSDKKSALDNDENLSHTVTITTTESNVPNLEVLESLPFDSNTNEDEKISIEATQPNDDVIEQATDVTESFANNIFDTESKQDDTKTDDSFSKNPIDVINENNDERLLDDSVIDDLIEKSIDSHNEHQENETLSKSDISEKFNEFIESIGTELPKLESETDNSDIFSDIVTNNDVSVSAPDINDDLEKPNDDIANDLDIQDITKPEITDEHFSLSENVNDGLSTDETLHDAVSDVMDKLNTNIDDIKDEYVQTHEAKGHLGDTDDIDGTDINDIMSDNIQDHIDVDDKTSLIDDLNNDLQENKENPFEDNTFMKNQTTEDNEIDDTFKDMVSELDNSHLMSNNDDLSSDMHNDNDQPDIHDEQSSIHKQSSNFLDDIEAPSMQADHDQSDLLEEIDISDIRNGNDRFDLHSGIDSDSENDQLNVQGQDISTVTDDNFDTIDNTADDVDDKLNSPNEISDDLRKETSDDFRHETSDDLRLDTSDDFTEFDDENKKVHDKIYDDPISFDDDIPDVRETPNLAEDIEDENTKTLIFHPETDQDMELSTCGIRLPSVCFSYEVEVMSTASTCEQGWYGHVLLDSCYRILDGKFSYDQARGMCKALGSRVAFGHSEFERKFILRAVEKDDRPVNGEGFWIEAAGNIRDCQYFDERAAALAINCDALLNIVCVKDAKSLSVYNADNTLYLNAGDVDVQTTEAEYKLLSLRYENNPLICELTSAASEFPVLWFKDGILLETKDKYITPDISLYINQSLAETFKTVTNRDITLAAMQGRYWCEVWDRKSLTRKTSTPYDVRFSDVISFHGSIQFWDFKLQDRILFNMMNEKFASLEYIELDLKTLFNDILMPLRAAFPDIVGVFTFIDKVRSTPSVTEYHTYLTLNRDYVLDEESLIYRRVKAILKSKLANSRYMASLPGGTPVSVFRTMSLQSTVSCPEAFQRTSSGVGGKTIPVKSFKFPQTRLGDFANSFDNCSSSNFYPAGTARCLGGFATGAYWGDVVANDCLDEAFIDNFNEQIWGSSPFTDKLSEIAKTVVKPDNVDKIVSQVAHITEVAAKLSPTDINKIADVLDHSTNVGKLSEKVGQNVLKTVDRLLASNEKEMHVANVETKAANRIIKSLERYAEQADLGKRKNIRMVSDNVVVELWDLKPNSGEVIGLAAKTSAKTMETPFQDEIIATVFNKTQLADANVDAAIELPREVFSQKEKGLSLGNRLTMMVFRKSKLFDAALTSEGKVLKATEQQLNNLNSYVISASIAGKKLTGLKDRVRTIFRPIKERDGTHKCVWWDFDMNGKRGGWSSAGCYYDGKINGRDICLCDHLTNFAVLLDFYGQSEPIPDHHELSLSIITVLGLALSILGLSLTIISYVFFRKLRQGRAQQTLFNLSLSLLFSMLTFLVGIKQTHNYIACLVVAIMLHYFILVSFMWMLMEAILQYLTFVKILGTYITRFTLKTVLPAWGLPLIPVIAVLSIDFHLYHGGPSYCWMDLPAFYFAFAIPVTSIIVINIIIFFITIVSIFRRGKGLRSNQKKQKIAMTNLQAAITSFILLGLTWMFGYLAISDARLPFQYVFTILNSLQGFFIFILFVVRKKKVRDQWYIICCKGGEKDRVSRSLSASNSIPSSYSNGSNRNSRNSRHERNRSDSTKTTQSTFSNSSGGFTNYGYEHGFDLPYNRNGKRFGKF